MVASDRISAFDYILPDEIPYKGEILTRISAFWFNRFKDLMPNHLITMDVSEYPEEYQKYGEYLTGRSMLVKKAKTVPIECIVRGYLTGSGKKTYDQDGTVCGIKLPAGLTEASKIPEPIFTPSTKAALGDHDENISFERCAEIVGEDVAAQLRDASLKLYTAAAEYALTRGIIIADTKFEFGFIDGKLTLIDEALTPDSSRFWPADGYEPGKVQPSYDKQWRAAPPARRGRQGYLGALSGGLRDHHWREVHPHEGVKCLCVKPLMLPRGRRRRQTRPSRRRTRRTRPTKMSARASRSAPSRVRSLRARLRRACAL